MQKHMNYQRTAQGHGIPEETWLKFTFSGFYTAQKMTVQAQYYFPVENKCVFSLRK